MSHGVPVTTYRSLWSNVPFRALFTIRLLEMTGIVVSSLAVGTVIYAHTDSPLLTAVAMFGGPVVQVVSSRYLLAASDLLRPRTALVLSGVIAAGTDLLQLIPGLSWPLRLALVATAYLMAAATGGSSIALLSDIVPRDTFVLARSALNVTVGGMQVLGNAVGALLLLAVRPVDLFLLSGVSALLGAVMARCTLRDYPARASGPVGRRTRRVNRQLLGSGAIRPIYVMMCVPNGLIVGCEALYIPYAPSRAGYLFAATSAGMLLGDILLGRFTPTTVRDRLIVPLRGLLAAPLLIMMLQPPIAVAGAALLCAGLGYAAALPLQDRLLRHVAAETKGQAFALASTAVLVGQSIGALVAGTLADQVGAGTTMTLLAAMSLLCTVLIAPGMRASRLGQGPPLDSRA